MAARKKTTSGSRSRKSTSSRSRSRSNKKYSPRAGKKVEKAMHEMKRGQLKSGRSGRKVKSRKQAIAIGPVSYTHLTLPTNREV